MKKIYTLLPLLLLFGCLNTQTPPEPEIDIPKEPEIQLTNVPNHETDIIKIKDNDLKPPVAKPVVILKTSKGDIKVELNVEKAPLTVKNFLNYVDRGFYKGTVFHRVIPNFMIQGGGITPNMKEKKTEPPIKNEAENGLSNTRGTIAMARTNLVDSATSQFFINVKDNKFLDHSSQNFGYCVFGKVISGMDVVDKIRKVKTGTRGYYSDVPVETVTIKEVVRIKKID